MEIREATEQDFDSIWPIFREIASTGETYAYDRSTPRDEAFELWMEYPRKTFVFEENGEILGTYYIVTNHSGPGDHVCNCGYMVSSNARGKGLATSMCEHSQEIAKLMGYKAMQFNSVVSTNEVAIELWKKLGYKIIGTIPRAFKHKKLGFVDSYIMHKELGIK